MSEMGHHCFNFLGQALQIEPRWTSSCRSGPLSLSLSLSERQTNREQHAWDARSATQAAGSASATFVGHARRVGGISLRPAAASFLSSCARLFLMMTSLISNRRRTAWRGEQPRPMHALATANRHQSNISTPRRLQCLPSVLSPNTSIGDRAAMEWLAGKEEASMAQAMLAPCNAVEAWSCTLRS